MNPGQPAPVRPAPIADARVSDADFRLLVEAIADYAIFLLDPDGHVAHLERRRRAHQGLRAPTRSSASTSRVFYPPEALGARLARSTSCEVARRDGPLRGRRLARAQGRHAVLGQRRHHRAARRRRRAARLRQGHARPHRAPAAEEELRAAARSASACWSRACTTTRSSCSTPTATSPAGTPARSASRATRADEIIGQHFSRLLSAGGRGQRLARATSSSMALRRRPLRGRRLARAQGRHAVLGQRGHHRAARRARHSYSASPRSRATSPTSAASRRWRTRAGASPSSSRCSATSCATRWRRSATRVAIMQLEPTASPTHAHVPRRHRPPGGAADAAGGRPARRRPHHQRQDPPASAQPVRAGARAGRRRSKRSSRWTRAAAHTLEARHCRTTPVWVSGDRARLLQVVSNLLDNAAKFTARGGASRSRCAARWRRADDRVRDNGAGIAPNASQDIFNLFVQGEQDPARSQGGLGLGLSLVQQMVALHGGDVACTAGGPRQGRGIRGHACRVAERRCRAARRRHRPRRRARPRGAGRRRQPRRRRHPGAKCWKPWASGCQGGFTTARGNGGGARAATGSRAARPGPARHGRAGLARRCAARRGPTPRLIALTGYGTARKIAWLPGARRFRCAPPASRPPSPS